MTQLNGALAALAESGLSSAPPAAGIFKSLVAKVKAVATNREAIKAVVGKQAILARGFFAPTSFSKPESRDVVLARIRANFAAYRSLYGVLFIIVLVYTVLSSPLLLIGLGMLGFAWAYAFVLTSPETPITVFGMELRRREKLLALAPFSVLVVTLCGLINSFLWVLVLTSLIALPHASFHEVVEVSVLASRASSKREKNSVAPAAWADNAAHTHRSMCCASSLSGEPLREMHSRALSLVLHHACFHCLRPSALPCR